MYLLIPGRHQLLTNFQFSYLSSLLQNSLNQKDINGKIIETTNIEAIIFAVTSANHSNTRRNPLPFYLRSINIELFGSELPVPVFIYGIDDVGSLANFATYTIKRIKHESDGMFNCTPKNTVVVCSTTVLSMYENLGFSILPAELIDKNSWKHHTPMPWNIVEHIAKSENELLHNDTYIKTHMHKTSIKIWQKYKLADRVKMLFNDAMISNDGDLTETRDYNVYVRQMDEIAMLKYNDTALYILPGRIGDIGCAVGSWIKLACKDERFRESDLYGIEVSRHLFEICRQRKENGEFDNPFVFFSQKNAVTGLVFDKNSMNTIHTSSLTHEIESYGSRADLLKFIKNRYEELAPNGVWINRDVVGPYNKEQTVLLWLNNEDGKNENPFKIIDDKNLLSNYLQSLSTYSKFLRFSVDFRATQNYHLNFELQEIENKKYIKLSLKDACEFLSRKDYCDNWVSEMNETFCYWDYTEWVQHMKEVGFKIHTASNAFTNPWIIENRYKGKAEIFDLNMQKIEWPVTNMILIGIKE